jgi:hypothetical protein
LNAAEQTRQLLLSDWRHDWQNQHAGGGRDDRARDAQPAGGELFAGARLGGYGDTT